MGYLWVEGTAGVNGIPAVGTFDKGVGLSKRADVAKLTKKFLEDVHRGNRFRIYHPELHGDYQGGE